MSVWPCECVRAEAANTWLPASVPSCGRGLACGGRTLGRGHGTGAYVRQAARMGRTHPPPRVVVFLEGMSSLQGSDKVRREAERSFVALCLLRARLAMATRQMLSVRPLRAFFPPRGGCCDGRNKVPGAPCPRSPAPRTSPGGGVTAPADGDNREETGLGCEARGAGRGARDAQPAERFACGTSPHRWFPWR